MNRLFLRFFLLVLLSVAVASLIIYFSIAHIFGDPFEKMARRQAAAHIFLIEQYVDKAPPDEWLTRLNKVREVSGSHYDLVPLAEARAALPPASHAALARGEVVLDVAHKALLRRVDLAGQRYVGSADEVIRARELPIDLGLALEMEALRFLIVALVLLVPIALWSRSHWRGLQTLSRVADEFGDGKLSARARLAPSASMYPLAERINHMAGRIEGLLASQQALLHSVSHELRTPIARLEFGLTLLGSATAEPALHKRIDAMGGDVAELNALVSELLTITRLDSEYALAPAPVDLDALLQACAANVPPSDNTLTLALPAPLGEVTGDARLLGRALANLLRNGVHYAASQVVLGAARVGDTVEITVDDDGPGIPGHERDKVFEPFYRLDRSRDRATGGFGLGLSIARKAMQLHGGSVTVEESALGGARMVLRLHAPGQA